LLDVIKMASCNSVSPPLFGEIEFFVRKLQSTIG